MFNCLSVTRQFWLSCDGKGDEILNKFTVAPKLINNFVSSPNKMYNFVQMFLHNLATRQTNTCSKSTKETLEKSVKYVQN